MIPVEHHRALGKTGLRIPPIVFSAAPLANACRVTPEQTRVALCVEWFKHSRPAVIDVTDRYDSNRALALIRHVAQRTEISLDDMIVCRRIDELPVRQSGADEAWAESIQPLGGGSDAQLVAIDGIDEYLSSSSSPVELDRRRRGSLDALRSVLALREERRVRGVGIGVTDWSIISEIIDSVPIDWVTLEGGPTPLHCPPELVQWLKSLADRGIGIITSSVFHGGFLVGDARLDGRALHPHDDADARLLAWRKSFAALCHGFGVTPAEACLQFTLGLPGVAAVVVNTSHPDRVAELAAAVARSIPPEFWTALQEEGLMQSHHNDG
jgi:D-threo-aldose 1-dehydrogenase